MMGDGGNLTVLEVEEVAGEVAALCGNLTEDYQHTWGSYEYWCEGVLFSSLGLFGD